MSAHTPAHRRARTPEELHALLEDAFNRSDLDALVAAYDDDATVVVPPDGRTVRGRDDIRAATAPLFALDLHLTSLVEKKVQTDGLALTHARWELVGVDARGHRTELGGRATLVSRRKPDGTWRIVLDDPLSPVPAGPMRAP